MFKKSQLLDVKGKPQPGETPNRGKPPTGGNPRNQVGTEKPIRMQVWVAIQTGGPQTLNAWNNHSSQAIQNQNLIVYN